MKGKILVASLICLGLILVIVSFNAYGKALLPDLVIHNKDVVISPVITTSGKPVKIEVKVYNQGFVPANKFTVAFMVSLPAGAQPQKAPPPVFRKDITVDRLNPKNSIKVSINFIPPKHGKYFVIVVADPENKVMELSKNNNKAVSSFDTLQPIPKITKKPSVK